MDAMDSTTLDGDVLTDHSKLSGLGSASNVESIKCLLATKRFKRFAFVIQFLNPINFRSKDLVFDTFGKYFLPDNCVRIIIF